MTNDIRFKILLVATEAVPFAKEGGVADVIGSLPKELEHSLTHNLSLDAELCQHAGTHAFGHAQYAQQEMLGADDVVF